VPAALAAPRCRPVARYSMLCCCCYVHLKRKRYGGNAAASRRRSPGRRHGSRRHFAAMPVIRRRRRRRRNTSIRRPTTFTPAAAPARRRGGVCRGAARRRPPPRRTDRQLLNPRSKSRYLCKRGAKPGAPAYMRAGGAAVTRFHLRRHATMLHCRSPVLRHYQPRCRQPVAILRPPVPPPLPRRRQPRQKME